MLSAILGNTQTANEEATELAAARQELVNKYAQQMRQDTVDALQYSNDMANSIGSLSHQLYNDQIQQKTAELSYNQGINTDYAGYAASKYTADANLAGALAGTAAGVYNNNVSSMAAIQAAIESGRATRDAARKEKESEYDPTKNKMRPNSYQPSN
jgi:gas vesicle protein